MRTNRTALATSLSVALAIASGAVVAQAVDEEPATPSHWTGANTEGPGFAIPGGEVGLIPGGYRTTVGLTYTVEADDPRASGDVSVALVWDYTGTSWGMGHGTGVSRLVNDGGSFEGIVHAVSYPDGSEFRMGLMEGQDGYEGLTLTMTDFIDPSGEGQPQGLIWEGEAPSLPDADALPG